MQCTNMPRPDTYLHPHSQVPTFTPCTGGNMTWSILTHLQDLNICDHCAAVSRRRHTCGRCRQPHYCDARCQKAAYKAHKGQCKEAVSKLADLHESDHSKLPWFPFLYLKYVMRVRPGSCTSTCQYDQTVHMHAPVNQLLHARTCKATVRLLCHKRFLSPEWQDPSSCGGAPVSSHLGRVLALRQSHSPQTDLSTEFPRAP